MEEEIIQEDFLGDCTITVEFERDGNPFVLNGKATGLFIEERTFTTFFGGLKNEQLGRILSERKFKLRADFLKEVHLARKNRKNQE